MVARVSFSALVLLGIGAAIWFFTKEGDPPPNASAPASSAATPREAPELKVALVAFGAEGRRPLAEGGAIADDEAVRIRITLSNPAHVMVVRQDRLGGVHLMYPPKRTGGRAIALPKGGPHELGQPLAKVQESETLHLYACAGSFTWSDVRALTERAGCARVKRTIKSKTAQ